MKGIFHRVKVRFLQPSWCKGRLVMFQVLNPEVKGLFYNYCMCLFDEFSLFCSVCIFNYFFERETYFTINIFVFCEKFLIIDVGIPRVLIKIFSVNFIFGLFKKSKWRPNCSCFVRLQILIFAYDNCRLEISFGWQRMDFKY